MSRIYVDRISPYQSGSLTIDGYQQQFDTGSLVTTASFNAYTASAPTLASNTFNGNQTVNGNGTINGTTGTPGNTFKVRDGNNTSRLEVNNSTLKGFTNVDVTLNGMVLINDGIGIRNTDPLPALPASAGGTLAVSGSNLYYHNGSSWSQIN